MKKFHWGYRIALVYILFVAVFIVLFVVSLQFKNELVTPDYYAEELKYQEKIDQINRAASLTSQPEWQINGSKIVIRFPDELKKQVRNLRVALYRPSDSSKDKSFSIQSIGEDGNIELDKSDLAEGRYRLQMSWSMEQLSYYKEGVVYL